MRQGAIQYTICRVRDDEEKQGDTLVQGWKCLNW